MLALLKKKEKEKENFIILTLFSKRGMFFFC